MASVFPSVRPSASDTVSQAERDVLDALATLPDGWQVIHSLWLKTHRIKLHAEADFVLVSDRAILILEVKGGNVWRDEAGWNFQSKSGRSKNTKPEGPFDQARGAYYALGGHLETIGRTDLFKDYVWGYGVICPECVLNISHRDSFVDPCMLLDERGFPDGLHGYIISLTDYWRKRYGNGDQSLDKNHGKRIDAISERKRSEIIAFLRPAFEQVIGPGASSVHSERDLITLTDGQLAALDFISLEPRNLLLGSAGTGKTILAVEQARRLASEGKKVLFLCFNRLLSEKLQRRFQGKGPPKVYVASYHQFVLSLCKVKQIDCPIAESWDSFCSGLQVASDQLMGSLDEDDLYDYLVIDEAQDLMSNEFMDLLDLLLKGGLSGGAWMMACDLQQAIFRGNFNNDMFERLAGWGRKTPLQINCRNTKQIAAYVTGLSGVGSHAARGVEGEMPMVRYFDGRQEYLRVLKRTVNELIQAYVEAKLPLSEIAILSGSNEFLPKEVMEPGFFLRVPLLTDCRTDHPSDCIQVCSVQGFKGLEARAVVIVGIPELSTTVWRDTFYVGASRARTNLRIILPKTSHEVGAALQTIFSLLGDVQYADEIIDS